MECTCAAPQREHETGPTCLGNCGATYAAARSAANVVFAYLEALWRADPHGVPCPLSFRPNHRGESTRSLAFSGKAYDFGLRRNLKPPVREETQTGFNLA